MSSADRGIAETQSRGGHYLLALLFMAVGSTVVLSAVVLMNEFSEAPERKEVERVTEIEVAKKPKPKQKQQTQKPRPKPRRAPKAPPRPALANMGSNLAGIAFDLPGLQFEDIGGNAKDLLQTNEDVVHTGDTVDTAPQPVEQPPPTYPSRLRDKGVEGYVVLSLLLDENGRIVQKKVIESKPPGEFDQAALEGVSNWRFQPAIYKGESVSVWTRQKIKFELARR